MIRFVAPASWQAALLASGLLQLQYYDGHNCAMSSFAAKRKARVIKIDDEEGSEGSSSSGVDSQGLQDGELLCSSF